MARRNGTGFSLTELMIALGLLGVIAMFTIPKVLQAQQANQHNAIAKESITLVSSAYEQYLLDNGVAPTTMRARDLAPYIKHVRYSTGPTVEIDKNPPGSGFWPCGWTSPCFHLHNGAILMARHVSFNGTASTNAISFFLDPDGKPTNADATASETKSLFLFLYYDGKVSSQGHCRPGTTDSDLFWPCPMASSYDPSWFSWN